MSSRSARCAQQSSIVSGMSYGGSSVERAGPNALREERELARAYVAELQAEPSATSQARANDMYGVPLADSIGSSGDRFWSFS